MIIQGSNNVSLNVSIVQQGALVPLAGSTISIVIKAGPRRVVKPSTIMGSGLVTTTMTSDDLSTAGLYYVQAVVSYIDGREFLSEISSFTVGQSL